MRVITIGRSPVSDFYVEDKSVSREHAKIIVHENGKMEILDLGSSFGTFLKLGEGVKKIIKDTVSPDQEIIFGKSEPQRVKEIINSLEEKTTVLFGGGAPHPSEQTKTAILKKRCVHCSSIVPAASKVCPVCDSGNI
ncbi:MAG: FHA domain-containing protein [Bdellovibrionales bacterium]